MHCKLELFFEKVLPWKQCDILDWSHRDNSGFTTWERPVQSNSIPNDFINVLGFSRYCLWCRWNWEKLVDEVLMRLFKVFFVFGIGFALQVASADQILTVAEVWPKQTILNDDRFGSAPLPERTHLFMHVNHYPGLKRVLVPVGAASNFTWNTNVNGVKALNSNSALELQADQNNVFDVGLRFDVLEISEKGPQASDCVVGWNIGYQYTDATSSFASQQIKQGSAFLLKDRNFVDYIFEPKFDTPPAVYYLSRIFNIKRTVSLTTETKSMIVNKLRFRQKFRVSRLMSLEFQLNDQSQLFDRYTL